MPWVQLKSNLRYTYRGVTYHRGVPVQVSEGVYHELMHLMSSFENPKQHPMMVYPKRLPLLNRQGSQLVIFRDMGLGDLLMLVPALRAFRRVYPRIRVVLAVGSAYVPLFRLPWARDLAERVEAIVDLEGNFQSFNLRGVPERSPDRDRKHRTDIFAEALKADPIAQSEYPVRVEIPEERRARAAELLASSGWGGEPIVAIGWRSSSHLRRIPEETLRAFSAEVIKRGLRPLILDDRPCDGAPHGAINIAGTTDILDFMALLSMATVAVSADTGVYHAAEAVGTPSVAVFTIVHPELRTVYYSRCLSLHRPEEKAGVTVEDLMTATVRAISLEESNATMIGAGKEAIHA